MTKCFWKSTFDVECLTCGFQRSFILLFEGDIWGSIQMFPATIPFVLTLLLTAFQLKFRFHQGPDWIVGLFSLTALLIVVNFIMKTLEHTHT